MEEKVFKALTKRGRNADINLQCIFIHWRDYINLGEDALRAVIPAKMHGIRSEVGIALMNIWKYLKENDGTIINTVANLLNQAYKDFLLYNEDQNFTIIIFCHSLGSAIIHDICINSKVKLEFKINHMIMAGSPVGLFLMLRDGIDRKDLAIPKCVGRLYKVNHPCDPVYHRIGKYLFLKN